MMTAIDILYRIAEEVSEILRSILKPRLASLLYQHYQLNPKCRVYMKVRSGRIVFANNAFLRATGYSLRQLRSGPLTKFVCQEDVVRTKSICEAMHEGDFVSTFTNRLIRESGEPITMVWTLVKMTGWYLAEATVESK